MSDDEELGPPPLSSKSSQIGEGDSDARNGPDNRPDERPESAPESGALEDPERLRELQESLGRLEDFAAQSQAENTTRAYTADLEDFRHWCKKYDREWLPAEPKTIGLYLGARADELSLATLERRLAAIASLHKEEGYESPASVAEGPLRTIWKGIVREKTRQQDGAPPLMVEDLRSIIEHLPRYSSSDEGPTGQLTLASLRDRALLLVGWTGALRRSELVALTTGDVQFVEGEGVNIYVRRSKSDQEAEGLVKGLPYGQNKETCPVTALRQWMQAAERQLGEPLFRRFYRGESIGESAMTAQYVSTVLKRHAESAGLDPDEYSAHSTPFGPVSSRRRSAPGRPSGASKSTPGTPRGRRSTSTSRRPGPFRTTPPRTSDSNVFLQTSLVPELRATGSGTARCQVPF
jgi:site-specific recombinase XerD